MTETTHAEKLFFDKAGLDKSRVQTIGDDVLYGADYGELFLEYRQSESFSWDDGRLKSASFDTSQGFGLRTVVGEATGYAHASELNEAAMRRAATAVEAVKSGHTGTYAEAPVRTNRSYYGEDNPLDEVPFSEKVKLLEMIDDYARTKDPRVCQVSASLLSSWQVIEIARPGSERSNDIRPLVRLNVSLVMAVSYTHLTLPTKA